MIDISCSIVLFHNPVEEITRAINSFLQCAKKVRLFLVDNSTDDSFRYIFGDMQGVEYIYNGRNLGYGAAHNIAVQQAVGKSKYHLILNPDVEFDPAIIGRLYKFMEQHEDIGLIMPKILYNNGDMQHLCKMLPSPVDLFMRRFIPGPLKFFFQKRLDIYELKNKDYDSIMETPNLSGCFMFIRTNVFREIGMFDERYFLYLEDTDLCRRINERYRTIYYPRVSIIHGYSKASYKSIKLMKLHLGSSIKYFNKWGWFRDAKRVFINTAILRNTYTPVMKVPVLSKLSAVSNDSITIDIKSGEVEVHDLKNLTLR
jgi:GT2 family glycosyltransferase